MNQHKNIRVIISGGGTGGHIFPAISVANALKRIEPATDILFVGASGRMEMERVPAAGYKIEGLPVEGFRRSRVWQNLRVLRMLLVSISRSRRILKDFCPDVVVGVGGYASGPLLWTASRMGIPSLIQEQNSYAGITNRILARRASRICVAWENMERFFPAEKIMFTGNPVREGFADVNSKREEGYRHFGTDSDTTNVLVLGGSLGAGSINSVPESVPADIIGSNITWIWQAGKNYCEKVKQVVEDNELTNVKVHCFIDRMDLAYAVADIIVSRAGAGTISELTMVGKPVILVPSPNVAEDHQTMNARALTDKRAAILLPDGEVAAELVKEVMKLAADSSLMAQLSDNIRSLAIENSDMVIAKEVLKLAGYDR